MKNVILIFVLCFVTQYSISQDLLKIDSSTLKNEQFIKNNNLKELIALSSSPDEGVAYIGLNETKIFNRENATRVLRINSQDIKALNKSFNFSKSVEIVIININAPNFNSNSIDCSSFNQFSNLKYVFFRYNSDIKLQKLSCLPTNILQVSEKLTNS